MLLIVLAAKLVASIIASYPHLWGFSGVRFLNNDEVWVATIFVLLQSNNEVK